LKPLSRLAAIALLSFAAVVGALSCDPAPPSVASDSGASADAGSSARDSGTPADAGAPFDAGPSADSGTSADSGSTSGGGEKVVITGKVSKLAGTGQVTPLSGATVEVVGVTPANSTTTASDGTYSLTVEPGTYFVKASKQDMFSTQVGVITSQSTAVTEMSLLEVATETIVVAQLGIKLDSRKGIAVVGFDTTDTGGGYKATLSAPAETSFALPEAGWPPSKNPAGTLPKGENALFFINVTPGTTTVTLTAPSGHSCTEALPLGNYRIDANVATAISATCK
jgi:hypothetical protein